MATEFTDGTTCLGYRSLFRANDKWLFRPSLALSLQLDRYFETVEWWRRNPDIHILHIIRTDNLAWLRSKFVARKADSFGAGKAYSADMTVTIPVHRAVKRLSMKQWLDSQLNRLKHSNPYHLVCYEELLEDRGSVMTNAQAFLGFDVQLMPEEQVRKRQSKGISIEQHVTNYSRLVSVLEREGLTTAPLPDDRYCRPR